MVQVYVCVEKMRHTHAEELNVIIFHHIFCLEHHPIKQRIKQCTAFVELQLLLKFKANAELQIK